MLDLLIIFTLCVASWLGTAGLWACLRSTLRRFRGGPAQPCALAMTLIKPVRGLDDMLEEGLRSIVESDPLKTLQVLISLETADDPAYPLARAFREAHPDRDVSILLTGPAGARMGKAHNMIEALPRARSRFILFCDADTRLTRGLLSDAARAFRAGADAVYAMPYHAKSSGAGGWWFMIAFNHCFCVPAALSADWGQLRSFAGAFMGYTREALEKMGGLERFSNVIAEDLRLGLAARRAGLRQELLRETVLVRETGTSPAEAFAHILKWSTIVLWSCPAAWFLAPLFNPVLQAAAALALAAASGRSLVLPGAALAAALGSRVSIAVIQDRALAPYRIPIAAYWRILLADLGGLIFWPLSLRRTISWRGRRYRLGPGGTCTVLP